ncbi:hypothetical protein RRG08_059350 [Elysia crispata]|uniref:Uncharacterized protein n=1 Tax=Elysia crispata TaxID=231223 RepID=A0AAE1BE19_9GAST|nr:hypothetical protein RRG08_059350 [Elysia crispata]
MKTLGYNNYDGGTDYDNSIEDGLTIIDMKHIQFQDDGDATGKAQEIEGEGASFPPWTYSFRSPCSQTFNTSNTSTDVPGNLIDAQQTPGFPDVSDASNGADKLARQS